LTAAPRLQPVADVATLPVYPIGPEERLDGNTFVKWNPDRWLASRTFKLMPFPVQGYHRALFDLCQKETPVGTLPDDDAELAVMLRTDARQIAEWRGMEFGAFRNWTRCRCGDRIRLMHPVVLEQVQDALDRRAMAKLSEDQRATAMRLDRLRKALAAQGLSKTVLADDVLVERIDAWLCETHRTRRTAAVYRSALLHAVQHRWFERAEWSG
jgi:hypothetical protein